MKCIGIFLLLPSAMVLPKLMKRLLNIELGSMGTTKFGIERFVYGFLDLISISFVSKYRKRPMHFFGTLGTISFLTGFISVLWMIWKKVEALHFSDNAEYRELLINLCFLSHGNNNWSSTIPSRLHWRNVGYEFQFKRRITFSKIRLELTNEVFLHNYPIYNRPKEVEELLDSLTKQTYSNFEILIIEDGSSVTCKKVTENYADRLDIKYHLKENGGQGFARNYGFERAKGEYMIVFDSDCLIPSDYLNTVNDFLDKNEVDAFGD